MNQAYDPAGRLYQSAGAATTRFLYDAGSPSGAGGVNVIGEYDGSNALLRRYAHGPGADEPLVWLEGSGTADRRFLMADVRGSVIAVTDAAGTVTNKNTYDAYGAPASGNVGRFQYTGQMWMAELKLYHFKARAYHPALGRFLQTDPIGYGDGLNLYQYAGSDPVNARDPSGLCSASNPESCSDQVVVYGTKCSGGCISGMALDDFLRSLNQFLGAEFLRSFGVGPNGEGGARGEDSNVLCQTLQNQYFQSILSGAVSGFVGGSVGGVPGAIAGGLIGGAVGAVSQLAADHLGDSPGIRAVVEGVAEFLSGGRRASGAFGAAIGGGVGGIVGGAIGGGVISGSAVVFSDRASRIRPQFNGWAAYRGFLKGSIGGIAGAAAGVAVSAGIEAVSTQLCQ